MNKTLLIFGILLGSFLTLFVVLYYNYTYDFENFNDMNSTNTPHTETDTDADTDTDVDTDTHDDTHAPAHADTNGDAENGDTTNNDAQIALQSDILTEDIESKVINVNACYSIFEANDHEIVEYTAYPLKTNILMQISTEKLSNIDNASSKWYDNINYNVQSSNNDNNKCWFNLSNNIKKIQNNKYATGAQLNNVSLIGPASWQFSSNHNTLSLGNFTILLTTKINNIDSNEQYCLFKLSLQKDIDYTTNTTLVNGGHIALVLEKMDCNNIILTIFFADKNFKWKIPINVLKKNILISFSFMHNEGITLFVDNLQKTYLFDTINQYKLGSTPIIINENGKIDMVLYNFTYYNMKLNDSDINSFINVNNYILHNKHITNDNYISTINDLNLVVSNKDQVIQTLQNELANSSR